MFMRFMYHLSNAGQYLIDDVADPNALSAFAASRYAHNAAMLSACHFLHHLFGNDSEFLSNARSLGLGLINQSPLIKSIFVKMAS